MYSSELNETNVDHVKALSFVTNLVGQAHSPMHVAPSQYAGGNNMTVWFREDPMTIHDFWDSKMMKARIIDNFGGNSSQYSRMLQQQASVYWNTSYSLNVTDWLSETAQLNCNRHIWNNVSQNANLTENYYVQMFPVMEQQLIIGGIRLGRYLDQLAYAD